MTEKTEQSAKRPKRSVRKIIFAVAAIALVAAVAWWVLNRNTESTDDAFVEADIAPIGSRIAGTVEKILVRENQEVAAGDTLVVIDQRDKKAALDAANAELAVARASVESAQAKLQGAQANVEAAQAETARRDADLKRYLALDKRLVSQQQLDTAQTATRTANASLKESENSVLAARSAIIEAQAQVQQAQARIEQAEVTFSYTTITAPISGYVTRKSVEPGQYLDAGSLLMMVVPHQVWVVANFKETQLTRMRPGQTVKIEVDTYPGQKFTGKIESLQAGSGARFSLFPPENATGNYIKVVQRIPVKILFDPYDEKKFFLSPGMSAVPTVDLSSGGPD